MQYWVRVLEKWEELQWDVANLVCVCVVEGVLPLCVKNE